MQAEMTYTEQLLHMLDDFDTATGLHIKLAPDDRTDTMIWTVTLTANKSAPRGRRAYIGYADDGQGYGWAPVPGKYRMEMGLTAEQALDKVREYLYATDAAKRLGAE